MDHQHNSPHRWLRSISLTACAAVSLISTANAGDPKVPGIEAASWKDHAISPVTNPIFFEDAAIRSEIRPIYVHHRIDDGFLGGGDANLYAVQLRYAITKRFAFIATQDGYFDINNNATGNPEGWMDLAAGFKYALIDDEANQFLLTPGLTFHIPSGDRDVFQGRGGGEFNPFVSIQKGFGDFHLSGNLGFRIPVTDEEQAKVAHYSLMADYHVCRWFIPFVSFNAFSIIDAGNNIGLTSEGYDVINFGSTGAQGKTQGMAGVGFRSNLTKSLSFGFAYEMAVIQPKGLTDDRFTFDMCVRF